MEELTYVEVVNQIVNKRRFGNLKGVEISGRMLEQLGSPQTGMKVIHIAGTNGKGSVSAFLRSILREAGKKVGMFTSPHLVDFRERIQVGGEKIPEKDVKRIGEYLLKQEFGVCPTMFDYCLCMAVLYFKEQSCDAVILETGLGGLFDSTNAISVPAVTVITKIGYDHMAILGNTLEEIASEKAGIIKKGTRLILESQTDGVLNVLIKAAKEAEVKSCQVVDPGEIQILGHRNGKQGFTFQRYEKIWMKMLGVHQYENAAASILAAEAFFAYEGKACLKEKERYESIRRGICETIWNGRMEILRKEPFLMVDGAHNSGGVRALKESLMFLFPGEQFHFIMGVMADKDYGKMIEELLPLAIDFKTVTVGNERSLRAEELAVCIRQKGIPAACSDELRECLKEGGSDDGGKTIAVGSLYFIGEILALFQDNSLY